MGDDDGMDSRRDANDARYIAETFSAARRWESASGRKARPKPLRELLWFVWQEPRLPGPLPVGGKYAFGLPWTGEARAAYLATPRAKKLLHLEHTQPIIGLVRQLVDEALENDALIALLQGTMELVVVTPEEARRLDSSSKGRAAPDPSDPLGRYRWAGIDVEQMRAMEPSEYEPTLSMRRLTRATTTN